MSGTPSCCHPPILLECPRYDRDADSHLLNTCISILSTITRYEIFFVSRNGFPIIRFICTIVIQPACLNVAKEKAPSSPAGTKGRRCPSLLFLEAGGKRRCSPVQIEGHPLGALRFFEFIHASGKSVNDYLDLACASETSGKGEMNEKGRRLKAKGSERRDPNFSFRTFSLQPLPSLAMTSRLC